MASQDSIFPTFFISGFECSSFVWKDQGRRDLAGETGHDRHAFDDYGFLRSLGIAVAREGVPWPMVDLGGGIYDLARLDPYIEAMNRHRIQPIWDLCHYGYPDDLDPFTPEFADRFARYADAVARYVTPRVDAPCFYTPINEITFFAFIGGEWAWVPPWGRTRETRERLRLALCRADIAAVKAIRSVDPKARMVHVDPLVLVVPPADRPDLVDAARHETFVDTFRAWDIISGRAHPELGGAPEILDIVGTNCYSFGQMEYREQGPHAALPPDDPRIVPLCHLLFDVWERYRRPMIVAETSGLKDGREDWLRDVVHEALAAVTLGVDLHGVCLFPAVDMPDWHTGEWLHNGLCDLIETEDGDLHRVPAQVYVDELRRWQRELRRVTVLDENPFDRPVALADIREAALRMQPRPDRNWF
jgi:beta-glucosidase/6-phospho-beta-glucosidase/beta-galactosidase